MKLGAIVAMLCIMAMFSTIVSASENEPLIKIKIEQEQICVGDHVTFRVLITNIDTQNKTYALFFDDEKEFKAFNKRPMGLYVESLHRDFVEEECRVEKPGEHQFTVDVVWTQDGVRKVATANTTFSVVERNVRSEPDEDIINSMSGTTVSTPGFGMMGVVVMCFLAMAAYKKRK